MTVRPPVRRRLREGLSLASHLTGKVPAGGAGPLQFTVPPSRRQLARVRLGALGSHSARASLVWRQQSRQAYERCGMLLMESSRRVAAGYSRLPTDVAVEEVTEGKVAAVGRLQYSSRDEVAAVLQREEKGEERRSEQTLILFKKGLQSSEALRIVAGLLQVRRADLQLQCSGSLPSRAMTAQFFSGHLTAENVRTVNTLFLVWRNMVHQYRERKGKGQANTKPPTLAGAVRVMKRWEATAESSSQLYFPGWALNGEDPMLYVKPADVRVSSDASEHWYRVILRDVALEKKEMIRAAVAALERRGCVNYHGSETFGDPTFPMTWVGAAGLRGRDRRYTACLPATRKRAVDAVCRCLWNVLASFRVMKHGRKVVVGDLVLPPENTQKHAVREWAAWLGGTPASGGVQVIRSESHALRFTIDDVVMPLPGSDPDCTMWPAHGCGKDVAEAMLRRLTGSDSITLSDLHSKAAKSGVEYRRLLVRPRKVQVSVHRTAVALRQPVPQASWREQPLVTGGHATGVGSDRPADGAAHVFLSFRLPAKASAAAVLGTAFRLSGPAQPKQTKQPGEEQVAFSEARRAHLERRSMRRPRRAAAKRPAES